ncbi:GNAT family N-acetyltransferase [Pseudolysobacter antarcticus]|uniref:GNAT family N-acetyltransferase n=1 Tax=Pseudolysobacter antarcticus TaxID=2511995 RepID=A0A411HM97_9GAMM|nr:GNAT family N-acetyltransferase [Pseudolysobacter antarcticus]QBB71613.1 GNAT family N-acetyltransferase [Pseudolysobacter antarcticus]
MHSATRDDVFDNPIWHTLHGPHARFAFDAGDMSGFEISHAPFLAVASSDARIDEAKAKALALSGRRHFLGPAPRRMPASWRIVQCSGVAQMHHTLTDLPKPAHPYAFEILDARHVPAMLALTAIAYPEFFRERTIELGRYLGIFDGGVLVAMAGERMLLPGAVELSAICTHPDFVGRGFARVLITELLTHQRAQNLISFLHVSETNSGAIKLYESMGFSTRTILPLTTIEVSAV